MAEDKKGFVLYADLIHMVLKMAKTPEGKQQVADLFITILEYVNDKNPVPVDPMVDILFEPIKQQLKRDLKKYEGIKAYRSEIGKKGGLAKASKGKQTLANANLSLANLPVTDTVTDTVKVTDTTKKDLREVFLQDLPNSRNFEKICTDLTIGKPALLMFIPLFKPYMEMSYADFDKFCNHFKRWTAIQLREQGTSKPTMRSFKLP